MVVDNEIQITFYLSFIYIGLSKSDAVRGASEDCDQNVWIYTLRVQTELAEKKCADCVNPI